MYLNQIYNLDQEKDQDKIFRYLVAMEENMLMWDDITDHIQEKYGLPTNEYLGVDIMNQNLTNCANIIYSGSVKWQDLSMFVNFNSLVMKNTNPTLVVTKNVQVDDMIRRCVDVKVYDYDELWDKHTKVDMKSARSSWSVPS